jgi:hypothetical protein
MAADNYVPLNFAQWKLRYRLAAPPVPIESTAGLETSPLTTSSPAGRYEELSLVKLDQ